VERPRLPSPHPRGGSCRPKAIMGACMRRFRQSRPGCPGHHLRPFERGHSCASISGARQSRFEGTDSIMKPVVVGGSAPRRSFRWDDLAFLSLNPRGQEIKIHETEPRPSKTEGMVFHSGLSLGLVLVLSCLMIDVHILQSDVLRLFRYLCERCACPPPALSPSPTCGAPPAACSPGRAPPPLCPASSRRGGATRPPLGGRGSSPRPWCSSPARR